MIIQPSNSRQYYNDITPCGSPARTDLYGQKMVIRLAGLKIEGNSESELLSDLPSKVCLASEMPEDSLACLIDRLRLLIGVYTIRYEMSHRTMMARYEAGELRMTKELFKWILAYRALELLQGHPPIQGLPEETRNIHYSSRIYKVWPH